MKRFFSAAALLCLGLGAFAVPSSQLEEFSRSPARFLMPRAAAGKTVTFCVQMTEEEWPFVTREDFSLQTAAALYEWTKGTAQAIVSAGRAEEFADILPLLENARFEQLPNCNLSSHPGASRFFDGISSGPEADISVIASPRYCKETFHKYNAFFMDSFHQAAPFVCFGTRFSSLLEPVGYPVTSMCREENDQAILANARTILQSAAKGEASLQTRRDLWRLNRCYSYERGALFGILVHELGHAFGAADEYTAVNNDPLYSSVEPQSGIMQRAYDEFGCSETDTAVLLLDRSLRRKRTFASFCQNGVVFSNGVQTVSRVTPAKIVLREGRTALISLTPGSPDSQTVLAEVWERDFSEETQTVLRALGWSGETPDAEIYCGGPQAGSGIRMGVWECILSRQGVFSGARIEYGSDGRLRRAVLKKISDGYARERFERMKNASNQKISRIQNEIKKSLD